MQLREWISHYIVFKDAIKKQIVDIQEKQDVILVREKGGEKTYYINTDLTQLLKKKNKGKTYYVCLNNKHNVGVLLRYWETLIDNKQLTILFVHPSLNEVWMISPTTHELISEKESLKEGILTLHKSITVMD